MQELHKDVVRENLPDAHIDEIEDILNELRRRSTNKFRTTNRIINRFHLLNHDEPAQG